MVKKWIISMALTSFAVLTGVILVTIYVDPFFVYHAPLDGISYRYTNEAYQVPGIARNFEYEQIVTGSSMTENFSTELLNTLFGTDDTVKLCYSGASLKNEADILQTALERKTNTVQRVFMSLDLWTFANEYTEVSNQSPEFLQDESLFNDAEYLLNKDVLLKNILPIVQRTAKHESTQTMDDAFRWYGFPYGDYAVLNQWDAPTYKEPVEQNPADQYMANTIDNIKNNLQPVIERNPEVDFYMFFPPYSILYWYGQKPNLESLLKIRECAANELLKYENVFLFDFQSDSKLILNLWNYKDTQHYSPKINDFIAQCFKSGDYLITDMKAAGQNNSKIRNMLSEWSLEEIKQNCLWSKDNILDYAEVFFQDNYRIFATVRTDSSWNWPGEMTEHWYALGSAYNLNENHDSSYYAIIENGKIQTEALGKELLTYENGNIRITSGVSWDEDSHIEIDHVEYSQNSRGINIVVYDKRSNRVVDSVAFDTCGGGGAERMNRWQ